MADNKKTPVYKRVAAVICLILIAFILVFLLYGMFTHNSGIIMASIFCLVIIPALIYAFLLLIRISKKS